MKTYYDVLVSLGACEAVKARKGITVEEAMLKACRGDWVLQLASRLKINKRKIILAKAGCARTVIHLMRDSRSKNAVEVAERFGNGEATDQELTAAADAAAAADAYAAAYAAYAAADADADAADAAAYAAYAAYAAAYAAAYTATDAADAYDAADAASKRSQKLTAEICVKILGADIIAAVNALISE